MPCGSSSQPKAPCKPKTQCKLVRICREEKVRVSEVSCPKKRENKIVCTKLKT